MISEILTFSSSVFNNLFEYAKNPAVSSAITGTLGWITSNFESSKLAENIKSLTEEELSEEKKSEIINESNAELERILNENSALQEELKAKLSSLNSEIEKESNSTTIINVKDNGKVVNNVNLNSQQDINFNF